MEDLETSTVGSVKFHTSSYFIHGSIVRPGCGIYGSLVGAESLGLALFILKKAERKLVLSETYLDFEQCFPTRDAGGTLAEGKLKCT